MVTSQGPMGYGESQGPIGSSQGPIGSSQGPIGSEESQVEINQGASGGPGCTERPDGDIQCSIGEGHNNGPGGDGEQTRADEEAGEETGDFAVSGGGTSNPIDPSEGGSGGHCVYNYLTNEIDLCVGNKY